MWILALPALTPTAVIFEGAPPKEGNWVFIHFKVLILSNLVVRFCNFRA
jgi:hypothetical protein